MNVMKMSLALLLAIACTSCAATKEGLALLPQPQSVEVSKKTVKIDSSLGFAAAPGTERQVEFFARQLRQSTGWSVPVKKRGDVRFSIDPSIGSGYRLLVTPKGIAVRGADQASLFHGFQTFLQLCPAAVYGQSPDASLSKGWKIPCVRISDEPRYAWRGILVDVSREFQTKEEMLKLIDSMAMVKLNVLHWHLTDDQGWRPEIKAYPKLTPDPAKSYTQEDLKEIVAYATERGIVIMPEIDVPGHSAAVARAYPDFCVARADGKGRHNVYDVSNPDVYVFLDTVMKELTAIFPGEYIHLGADEVNTGCWKQDPGCKKLMEKLGTNRTGDLQAHFVAKVSAIINKYDRKAIAWDEALHGGGDTNLAIMSWRGVKPGIKAAKLGHKVVLTPVSALYYDRSQSRSKADSKGYSRNTVIMSQSYFFEPGISTLDAAAKANILGAQGCVWGEMINGGDHLQRQVMPRGAALAENLWSPREALDWESFMARLEVHRARMDARGIPYWWEPETTPRKVGSWKTVPTKGEGEIDVSKFVVKAGLHEFIFHYKQGVGSFNLLQAELLENGEVVAVDTHAHTGTVDGRGVNQFYLLKLPEHNPTEKYTLRYKIEAVKGGCSGVVMLVPPLEAEQYSKDRGPETKSNVSGQKQPDEL